jgi:iron complex transport system substrate-binding protein
LAAPCEAARAISLDTCADQYLLALAPAEEIAAVSRGATSEYSRLRARARGLVRIRPTAEESAPLGADIVLRFWGGDARLLRLLEKSGARVVTLDHASDFDGVRANVRRAAAALGRQEAGAALLADMDRRLDALAAGAPARRIGALYATPGGVTAGAGTMIDAILQAAGVVNLAAEAGHSWWPPLPAETLLLDPPDLIVTGFFASPTERVSQWSLARHPALRSLFRERTVVTLPDDVAGCPAWFSVDAAEMIAAATRGQGAGE